MSAPNFFPPATRTGHDQHGRYPQALTVADFQHNLATVQTRMAAACQRAGRNAASVRCCR
jgi:ribosomal protein S17E